ncbi:protein FAR1-RELATED SEQUENCE 5-like [Arachis ipaensis]|uniref:protein FAR1-RELATED SEQUENCE 5-like n=1 Tax=Arachis ipaensis TaxID=130454 RepID=UPI0007AF2E92|nr:protein FAR1-RELATED SEQUENCE 5-like [Arachis ipaensis]
MQWQGNSLTLVHFMRPTLRKLVALCREDCGSVNVKQIESRSCSSSDGAGARLSFPGGGSTCVGEDWSASLESALCYGWDSVDAQKMEYRSWARLPSIANCRWRRVCSQNNSNQLQTWRIKVNVYNELHRVRSIHIHITMCKEIDEMGISSFMATNSRDGYHKGDARCDPGNQTDDSAEFDVMNEDSDEEASGYGDKGDYGKDENGNLIRRRFFCNWAGLRDEKHYARLDRKRMHKPETRTNCEAKLSIYLDRGTSNWKVRKVILDHNHDLTPIGMVHLMLQFCGLSDATKAHMESMHSYGLPTSKIVGYMSGIAGGYSLLGFTKKDAYNHLDKKKRGNVADGDTNATVVYLQGKAAADPMSMVRYNVTNEGMLANLFWEDGASRAEFQHFGDVVAFDSTYRKNKYRRLLVIFSGTNNHRQTTIFGFGLLLDETTASYMWVLENLLEVMCNRMPSVVVTNGDDAFIAAVR